MIVSRMSDATKSHFPKFKEHFLSRDSTMISMSSDISFPLRNEKKNVQVLRKITIYGNIISLHTVLCIV